MNYDPVTEVTEISEWQVGNGSSTLTDISPKDLPEGIYRKYMDAARFAGKFLRNQVYKVKFAMDCPLCEGCGEPWCEEHDMHYADCPCIGPTQDGYEYIVVNDELYALSIEESVKEAV